jgi:hypothetical protein
MTCRSASRPSEQPRSRQGSTTRTATRRRIRAPVRHHRVHERREQPARLQFPFANAASASSAHASSSRSIEGTTSTTTPRESRTTGGERKAHARLRLRSCTSSRSTTPSRRRTSSRQVEPVAGAIALRRRCANGAVTDRHQPPGEESADRRLPGSNSTAAIGTLVEHRRPRERAHPVWSGHCKTTYRGPWCRWPRVGAAYDLTGHQAMVLRGGIGLFFDRPTATRSSAR